MTEILVMPDLTEDIKMTDMKHIQRGNYHRQQREQSDRSELIWFALALVLAICWPVLLELAASSW